MIIDCIADLHGHYPKLEGGDLLIVAGDLTAGDAPQDWQEFINWLMIQPYKKRIFIGGNHDVELEQIGCYNPTDRTEYLCDSATEFEGLKIWGSPWTLRFPGMNPDCMAFTVDIEEELEEKWRQIPHDVDILITHSPPHGKMDQALRYGIDGYEHVGSHSLSYYVQMHQPKLHVFGHIHEGYGYFEDCLHYVNASHVNERYEPVNKPIRVIL